MPLTKLELRPGVNIEVTQTKNEAGFSRGQLIRFFGGQVQKYGGWSRLAGIEPLAGICRGLFGWADLLGNPYLAAGTDQRLYVVRGGILSDITPVTTTRNITPAFSTTTASRVVKVQDTGAQPQVGDWVNIPTHVSRGGVVLFGAYQVTSVLDSTTYIIQADRNATITTPFGGQVAVYSTQSGSTTVTVTLADHGLTNGAIYVAGVTTSIAGISIAGNYVVQTVPDTNTITITANAAANATTSLAENGGNVRLEYLISSGVPDTVSTGGWGAGDWGAGDWGASNEAGGGGSTPIVTNARTWSLDHFGEDLIASPDKGAIYHWSPPDDVPATVVSGSAPAINNVVFSMSQVQMIVACGSEAGGVHYPTLIRWCDSGDFTAWVASASNQAGSYQLPTGSYVVAGMATGLGALIWTDSDLWLMTYQGLPYVFGFNQIGVACECLAKKAPVAIGSEVIWPSVRGFYRFDNGGVVPMACPVWDWFFDNLDLTQSDKVCSAKNSLFNEVAWFFPKAAGGIGYVKWNYLERVWDYGSMSRTAWFDHSPFGNPVGVDEFGVIQQHERGNDADGGAMESWVETGYFDIEDGTDLVYVSVLIPDFVVSSGTTVQMSVLATDYPGDPPRTYGPYSITSTTRRVNVSLRARQIAFRFGSVDMGSFWRLGAVRYSWARAGSR